MKKILQRKAATNVHLYSIADCPKKILFIFRQRPKKLFLLIRWLKLTAMIKIKNTLQPILCMYSKWQ
jgi:hypothetical protein